MIPERRFDWVGVSCVVSGDGGPGDSFEDLETSRIARIPRGLRVTCGLGSVEPGNSLAHFGSDRLASRRAFGRLMDTTALDWALVSVPFACPAHRRGPKGTKMDTNLSRDPTSGGRRGVEAAELSNAMVRLYKELFGRGPTKAHSAFATPDLVVCTLEESLTAAERKLVELGEHQALRDTRMLFQHASDDEFVQAVEAITGRVVRAFVSGIDTEKDVSSEVFYLQPLASPERDGDGASPGQG
jgi:uncharacterized protein YbcI